MVVVGKLGKARQGNTLGCIYDNITFLAPFPMELEKVWSNSLRIVFSSRCPTFLAAAALEVYNCIGTKGQLISKCLFGVFTFFQKTNKNKSTSSKVEFVCSVFCRNVSLKKSFRIFLTIKLKKEQQEMRLSFRKCFNFIIE